MSFYKKSYKTNFKKAEVYLIKDSTLRMFFRAGKKILKLRRDYPLEVFNSEQEALSWLESIDKIDRRSAF